MDDTTKQVPSVMKAEVNLVDLEERRGRPRTRDGATQSLPVSRRRDASVRRIRENGSKALLLVMGLLLGCSTLSGVDAGKNKAIVAASSGQEVRRRFQNLLENSLFQTDLDADGVPDGWQRGEGPSIYKESKTGCDRVGASSEKRAIWIRGGKDQAGEWSTRVRGIEPGTTYVLSFHLFRSGFRNGWYPEMDLFGQRILVNHHATYGAWQGFELLVRAPASGARETLFRFINRYPCRFWMLYPKLRPYSLAWEEPRATDSGFLLHWRETACDLVLKMELTITNAEGVSSRRSFLNVEARKAWEQLHGTGNRSTEAEEGSPHGMLVASRPELAWLAAQGGGPFRVELSAQFEGEILERISMDGLLLGGAPGGADLSDVPPGLKPARPLPAGFFPIGIFNVPLEGVEKVQEAGFNTAYLSVPRETIEEMADVERNAQPEAFAPSVEKRTFAQDVRALPDSPLHWMISLRKGRGPVFEEDLPLLKDLSRNLGKSRDRLLCVYTADEPELSGISPALLYRSKGWVRRMFPNTSTVAAVFREKLLPYYQYCSDWFFVDPYPVPNRPLTWMAETLEHARNAVGEGRVLACVQAFGGNDVYASSAKGWARFPTLEEMRVLAFLSIVHGAGGVFFYDYPAASAEEEHWRNVRTLVDELNRTCDRLRTSTSGQALTVWTLGARGWERDKGQIHHAFYMDEEAREWTLVAINPSTWRREICFDGMEGVEGVGTEVLGIRPVVVKEGKLFDTLEPLAVRVYTSETFTH